MLSFRELPLADLQLSSTFQQLIKLIRFLIAFKLSPDYSCYSMRNIWWPPWMISDYSWFICRFSIFVVNRRVMSERKVWSLLFCFPPLITCFLFRSKGRPRVTRNFSLFTIRWLINEFFYVSNSWLGFPGLSSSSFLSPYLRINSLFIAQP